MKTYTLPNYETVTLAKRNELNGDIEALGNNCFLYDDKNVATFRAELTIQFTGAEFYPQFYFSNTKRDGAEYFTTLNGTRYTVSCRASCYHSSEGFNVPRWADVTIYKAGAPFGDTSHAARAQAIAQCCYLADRIVAQFPGAVLDAFRLRLCRDQNSAGDELKRALQNVTDSRLKLERARHALAFFDSFAIPTGAHWERGEWRAYFESVEKEIHADRDDSRVALRIPNLSESIKGARAVEILERIASSLHADSHPSERLAFVRQSLIAAGYLPEESAPV